MKLNLGCGSKRIAGYVNVDCCGEPDVFCDLSSFPWPWPENAVEEVYASHFLEHAADYEKTILEIHRILKPDGVFWFKVPHHRHLLAVWHLHRQQFSTYTPDFLCQSIPYQWGGRRLFRRSLLRINYPHIPPILGIPMSWLANVCPYLWDWLGWPIDEVEFKGVKIDTNTRRLSCES